MMLAGVMQEVRREIVGHSSQQSRDVNDRYTQIEPRRRSAKRSGSSKPGSKARNVLLQAEKQRRCFSLHLNHHRNHGGTRT